MVTDAHHMYDLHVEDLIRTRLSRGHFLMVLSHLVVFIRARAHRIDIRIVIVSCR